MNDQDLELAVTAELRWDAKVDNQAVAVSVKDGIVTLRGTVGSFRERREATMAVKRVGGVVHVDNELDVWLLDDDRRKDADLRGDVLQALILDELVPRSVHATVKDGFVRLSGSAQWQYQREEAEFIAGNVRGVVGLQDDIHLTMPSVDPDAVKHAIKKALKRGAKIDADEISVSTQHGTITLTGTVTSWYEHDTAVTAAWSAPGVNDVDDRLTVVT